MSTSGGGGGITNTPGRSNISVTSINCTNSVPTISTTPSTLALRTNDSSISSIASMQDNGTTIVGGAGASGNGGSSGNGGGSSIAGGPGDATLNNGNHFYGNGSIRISVPKMDESDESETELSHIENAAAAAGTVNMRTANFNKNGPRPMSWEGELSENEDPMDGESPATANDKIASQTHAVAQNLVKQTVNVTENVPLISHDAIKPEFNEYTTAEPNVGPTFPSNAGKRYPVDISNLKYEPGVIHESNSVNSPLLARSKTTLLPANPSPDSAIHSVYTHSSPSQSPLTSRHAPYTPSLSRNNSDASYSSCYSYGSEFSPTHSPIQGRHNISNMYTNFNGSPLHHSVLYKPMVDGENMKMQAQTHEDTLLEAEAIPSAGISRQQLINR